MCSSSYDFTNNHIWFRDSALLLLSSHPLISDVPFAPALRIPFHGINTVNYIGTTRRALQKLIAEQRRHFPGFT